MSQATINIVKTQLKKVEEEMPRLRKLVGEFEQRLAAAIKSVPPSVDRNDPKFATPLGDLDLCRNMVSDVKGKIGEHVKKLAKYQAALQAAERALAEEMK